MEKKIQNTNTSLKYSKVTFPFSIEITEANRSELYEILYTKNHIVGGYLDEKVPSKCVSLYVASKRKLNILLENNTSIPFKSKNMKSVTGVLVDYKSRN